LADTILPQSTAASITTAGPFAAVGVLAAGATPVAVDVSGRNTQEHGTPPLHKLTGEVFS